LWQTQIFRDERVDNRVVQLAANQQAVPAYTFANRAGLFRDSLTGRVINRGHNLNAPETELGKTKLRRQARGAGREAAAQGTGPYQYPRLAN